MQGFELATIFVAPADFQNFGETDSRKLVGLFGGPTRCFTIPPSHAVWAPRGPEASRDLFWDLWRPDLGISGGLVWDLLSFLSSIFSLLPSLFSLLLAVVVLRGLDPMSRVIHSIHDLFSLVSALFSLLSSFVPASLSALPSSFLGYHPAIRGLNLP